MTYLLFILLLTIYLNIVKALVVIETTFSTAWAELSTINEFKLRAVYSKFSIIIWLPGFIAAYILFNILGVVIFFGFVINSVLYIYTQQYKQCDPVLGINYYTYSYRLKRDCPDWLVRTLPIWQLYIIWNGLFGVVLYLFLR